MEKPKKNTLEDYQTVITEAYDDWSDFLGIQHQWSVEIVYKPKKHMSDGDVVAEVDWPWNYRTATMRFNIEHLIKTQPSFRDIQETVVHELGHLVNADMWDLINSNFQGNIRKMILDQMEKEIDTWTRIVMRAREEGSDDGVVSGSNDSFGASLQDGLQQSYS